MNKKLCILFCIIGFYMTGFRPPHNNRGLITKLHFHHLVGKIPLKLFDETFTNPFGEPFVISKFKYYISHISFTDYRNNSTSLASNYYLVNEEDSLSKIIELPVTGPIRSLSFVIGVDSIKNVGGVQTGSLDPANGMFWTWNSGYVFAKLEGQSDSSHAAVHSFSWHIGGFRKKEDALRTVTLQINQSPAVDGNTIDINANILKWFDAVHPLKITASPICHQPGKLAMQVADNYSTMFSVAP